MEPADVTVSERQRDTRTTDELIAEALTEVIAMENNESDESDDSEILAPLSALTELHRRGGQEIFERAKALCQSSEPHERQLGALILGQLGIPHPEERASSPFYAESVAILLGMLAREQDAATLSDIAIALGHRGDPSAIAPLVSLRNHPNADVRYGVAFALMGYEDDRAINALIALSADEEDKVRDWATFALGVQISTDTPAIRDALAARLGDSDDEARGEAFVGLARRHDPRMIAPLLADLNDLLTSVPPDQWGTLCFEAAEESGASQLHGVLLRMRLAWDTAAIQHDWRYHALEDAIRTTDRNASDTAGGVDGDEEP